MECNTNRLLLLAPLLVSAAFPLRAGLTDVDIFKNFVYIQTSGAAPSVSIGTFLSLREFFANPGDFDTGSVTYPGAGSPQSLSLDAPNKLLTFQTGFLPDQAAMDAAYPFGTYQFTATNSGTSGSQTAEIPYTTDAYANIPAFTSATMTELLAGVYAGGPITLNFNANTPSADASVGITFLSIFGSSFSNSYSTSTTSVTIPAGTLVPGTTYTAELDFSDRVSGSNAGVPTAIGFDVRTEVTFTTLAPEPGSLALGALGVTALVLALRRRIG